MKSSRVFFLGYSCFLPGKEFYIISLFLITLPNCYLDFVNLLIYSKM